MPTRRKHTKSRKGCNICKQGKVRCDLQQPICGRCARLERPCSFMGLTKHETVPRISTAVSPTPSSIDKPAPEEDVLNIPDATIRLLELMHHWTTCAYASLTDQPQDLTIWQQKVPSLSFKHKYLLYGILSYSLVHSQLSEQGDPMTERSLEVARSYQAQAIPLYVQDLENIGSENSDALFIFSTVLAATALAFMRCSEEQVFPDTLIQSFTDLMTLLVGSTTVAEHGKVWLRKGEFSNLLVPNPFLEPITTNFEEEAQKSIMAGLTMQQRTLDSSEESCTRVCSVCAQRLLQLFPVTREKLPMNMVIGWMPLAGIHLVPWIRQQNPVALLLLAHFGVVLHRHEHMWYLKGLGKRLVMEVLKSIDTNYIRMLEWPTTELGIDIIART